MFLEGRADVYQYSVLGAALPDKAPKRVAVNLVDGAGIQWHGQRELRNSYDDLEKSDWKRFYEAARRPWRHRRPPRPVYPTGLNRVLPAQGFSLSELDDAGVIKLRKAESLRGEHAI